MTFEFLTQDGYTAKESKHFGDWEKNHNAEIFFRQYSH